MKTSIAWLAISLVAPAAFADVVSLAPGQQIVVPATQPGTVPVVIEAGLLKQTSQLSFLPYYECQGLAAAQLQDPNGVAADDNFCVVGGIQILSQLINATQGKITSDKPANVRSTYATSFPYGFSPQPYLFRDDINATWTALKLDLSTGAPSEVTSLLNYTITDGVSSGWSTGGSFRESNMRLVAADKKIYSNVDGINTATTRRPAVTYKQVSFPVWTFDSWEGPALPLKRLASTSSESERTKILAEAGFKVTPLGDGTLYASGTYRTLNMRMTPEGQVIFSNSLGFLANFRNALRAIFSGSDQFYYNPMSFAANIGYFIN